MVHVDEVLCALPWGEWRGNMGNFTLRLYNEEDRM